MPKYYYIADKPTRSAVCFNNLKDAKNFALEKKSPIYRNKFDLPEWVEKIEGFCDTTIRRADGKFAKQFSQKFFNIDIKTVDNNKNDVI